MRKAVLAVLALVLISSCVPATPTPPASRTATPVPSISTPDSPTPSPLPSPTTPPSATSISRPNSCIPEKEPVEAQVVRIIDGDTIEVAVAGAIESVRLIGIDTPERGEAGFNEAALYTKSIVDGKTVMLWQDTSDRDRYNRLLAYVTVGHTFLNLNLVREGYAVPYRYPPDTSCSSLFDAVAPKPTSTPFVLIIPTLPPAQTGCHPSYEGACLKVGAGDYDCAGGGGNGPNYTGKVRVVGWDEFKLDSDGDGWGCE